MMPRRFIFFAALFAAAAADFAPLIAHLLLMRAARMPCRLIAFDMRARAAF